MKKRYFIILLCALLLLVGCKKESTDGNMSVASEEKNTSAENKAENKKEFVNASGNQVELTYCYSSENEDGPIHMYKDKDGAVYVFDDEQHLLSYSAVGTEGVEKRSVISKEDASILADEYAKNVLGEEYGKYVKQEVLFDEQQYHISYSYKVAGCIEVAECTVVLENDGTLAQVATPRFASADDLRSQLNQEELQKDIESFVQESCAAYGDELISYEIVSMTPEQAEGKYRVEIAVNLRYRRDGIELAAGETFYYPLET